MCGWYIFARGQRLGIRGCRRWSDPFLSFSRSGLGFPESNGTTELRILWVPSYTPYADCGDVEMFSCV